MCPLRSSFAVSLPGAVLCWESPALLCCPIPDVICVGEHSPKCSLVMIGCEVCQCQQGNGRHGGS